MNQGGMGGNLSALQRPTSPPAIQQQRRQQQQQQQMPVHLAR
jgi:hypothetical protein